MERGYTIALCVMIKARHVLILKLFLTKRQLGEKKLTGQQFAEKSMLRAKVRF